MLRTGRWAGMLVAEGFLLMTVGAQAAEYNRQPNLISNGNFESGSGGMPSVWYTAGNSTFSWTTAMRVSTTHSVKIYNGADQGGDWRQLVTGLTSNIQYRFRTHVYATDASEGACRVELHWYNGATYLDHYIYPVTQANQWFELIVEDIQPPAGTDRVYVLLRAPSKPGSYYYDDAMFCRKDENLFTLNINSTARFPFGIYTLPGYLIGDYSLIADYSLNSYDPGSSYPGAPNDAAPIGPRPGAWYILPATPPTGVTQGYSTSVYHSSPNSLYTTISGTEGAQWRQILTNLDPNWTYNFSAWVMASNVAPGSHNIQIHWYNANNESTGLEIYSATTADEWVNLTATNIVPPAGTVKAYIILGGGLPGTYYFDDIALSVNWSTLDRYTEAANAGFSLAFSSYYETMTDTGTAGMKAGLTILWQDPAECVGWACPNPALSIWVGYDEPAWAGITPEDIISRYNTILSLDSYYSSAPHKVLVNHAPRGTNTSPSDFTTLRPYNPGLDIVAMDLYPVPEGNGHSNLTNQTISCVGDYVDILYQQVMKWDNATVQRTNQGKPIWMLLQGCGWNEMPGITQFCWTRAAIEIQWYGPGGPISRTVAPCYVPNTWMPVAAEYITPPAGATSAQVMLRTYCRGTYYFDNLWLWDGTNNILVNNDFETNPTTDYTWGRLVTSGSATQSWESSVYYGGSHSVKTVMQSDGVVDWRQSVAIDPNKTYYFYGMIRADVRPTWQQTRFMAYDAIIHGARGLVEWGIGYAPQNATIWTDLKRLAGEISGLNTPLVSPLSFRTVTTGNSNIETVLFKNGSGLCLIAANRTATTRSNVSITTSGLPITSVTRTAGETGSISISSNRFYDTFTGYQVHVYHLD